MKNKVKIIALKTQDDTMLWEDRMGEGVKWLRVAQFKNQILCPSWSKRHLYALDENSVINKGDWYYNGRVDRVYQWIQNYSRGNKEDFKIVATTDFALIKDGIPGMSQEFVQEYVESKKYGSAYIEVEYKSGWSKLLTEKANEPAGYHTQPKLDENKNALLFTEQKVAEQDIFAAAQKASEEEFPYHAYRGKRVGVNDDHTGEALRGAYCAGFEAGYKHSQENKP